MEQVIATINYFVREKLWCSIRKLCDLVSLHHFQILTLYSLRKWKKEWTQCWCSGKPSASSKKVQWPRRSVSWLGSKSAEKLTFLRQWLSFITMRGADTSTRRQSTHSPLLWMRRSRWRAIAISSLAALSYGTHSNLSGAVRSFNGCLTTTLPVSPHRHSKGGYICRRLKKSYSRKHCSSLSKC